MALEALDYFFQQQQQEYSPFFTQFTSKDPLHSFLCSTPNWTSDFDRGDDYFLDHHTDDHQNWEKYFPTLPPSSSIMAEIVTAGSPESNGGGNPPSPSSPAATAEAEAVPPRGKKPRRQARSRKNKEETESQRMTHIAVERNRRKQMNEYLSVLRSLMPDSYVQRGDQASIIGGAINFVKELEQRLQHLGAIIHHKETKRKSTDREDHQSPPFAEFFTFPQYSSSTSSPQCHDGGSGRVGDVEVTMVESHASVRIRWRKQGRQLLRLVAGLQSFRLSVLHLNVTTAAAYEDDRPTVLYSLSLKVEDDCRLNTVDEIATAVYEMLDDGISHEA
ncbi:unnamed protein product [Linum trigynum]|uniref:BHLH domain-containing protein n=1 Tax=Linum trigynum TaxID=586398 RepID=A0AAV2F5U6_9ROSI